MSNVPFFDAETIRQRTPYAKLIDALDRIFQGGATAPPRHHHTIPQVDAADATLLLMPAWRETGALGVKIVNVFPGNSDRGMPAVNGIYLIFNGQTGELMATADGSELTARRTAAASALASRFVSRPDSSTLLMIGTGRLASELIESHQVVRPISRVLVWGRNEEKARNIVARFAGHDVDIAATTDLEQAVGQADIISTATLSSEPLVRGAWLEPGAHLDLVGAFRPDMRETDDEVMRRAGSVYVDTRDGALQEGGDLVLAMATGSLPQEKIVAELSELTRGKRVERSPSEITVFKSVGASIEDLAAAELCLADQKKPG